MPRHWLSIRCRLPRLLYSTATLVSGVTLLASTLFAQPKVNVPRTGTRVAVYDSRSVFDSMPERAEVLGTFAEVQEKAHAQVKAASDSLRLALDDLVRFEAHMTPREREAGKLNLRARELLVEQMVENLDAIIQQRQTELQEPVRARIRDAVRRVRVRDGYHLVIDRAAEGLEFDADDAIDVTHAILVELRRTERQMSRGGKASS